MIHRHKLKGHSIKEELYFIKMQFFNIDKKEQIFAKYHFKFLFIINFKIMTPLICLLFTMLIREILNTHSSSEVLNMSFPYLHNIPFWRLID